MTEKKYDPLVGWTITESKNFILTGEYEKAALYSKSDGSFIAFVGDFYGEPKDGIIDVNEKYCVTVGCGIIVYRLVTPFESYQYHRNTNQWYEIGRETDRIEWIEGSRQVSDHQIELVMEDDTYKRITLEI